MITDLMYKVKELTETLAKMQADIKELQDVSGISFDRWKATRKEQNTLYIRDRMAHYRSQGEGLMTANKLAVQDLRDLHKRELYTQ
jgi:cupin superfamily acireductone dioxygenase involved in methionine salvage